MRKSPLAVCILLVTCAIVAPFAGAGSTASTAERLAPVGSEGSAAVHLPTAAPTKAADGGAVGYRSSDQLAADLQRPAPVASSMSATPDGEVTSSGTTTSNAPAADSGSGATVVVTATVLPIRTIVVKGGEITELWSNTDDLDPANSLYVAREGSNSGDVVALDADTWAQARALFARANVASGRVY